MTTLFFVIIAIIIIIFVLKSAGTAKEITELKAALIGKYVFERLDDMQKNKVIKLSNERLLQGYRGTNTEVQLREKGITLENGYDPIVRYMFYALAMMEIGIKPGVTKFDWIYVPNPLRVRLYDKKFFYKAKDQLERYHGIKVSIP